MSAPDFSIVIPTHNRPAMLAEALDSLRNQTGTSLEAIVVDDASTPAVDAAALGTLEGQPVHLIRNEASSGGAASKTAGARLAQGRFIGFLDDDDLLHPDYVAALTRAFDNHPDIDVFFVDVEWFGDNPKASDRNHRAATEAVIAATGHERAPDGSILFRSGLLEALVRSTPMQFQRPVLRREVLERVGGFRPDCLLWDCDWAIRAALQVRCAYLPQPLYRQREQGQGYYTKPGRALATATSIYEITERLYRRPPIALDAATRALLQRLAALKAFDVAYLHSLQGDVAAALRHWWQSQRLQPSLSPSRLRLPLGALWRALKAA